MGKPKELEDIKCVVVGDGNVGKTCMLISYTTNEFPLQYVPTVFDTYAMTMIVSKCAYSVRLFDTAGQEDYDKLRPLSYPRTDVFLLCFAISEPESFHHITSKWALEIKHFQPDTPFILVGTKADLRDDSETKMRLAKNHQRPISPEQGSQLARAIKAERYIECSALTQGNLSVVFDQAVITAKKYKDRPKKARCLVL